MVHETRFRDMLTIHENWDLVSRKVSRILERDVKLVIIGKEIPIMRDVAGYQVRFPDIVAIDENRNLLVIELKRSIKKGKIIKDNF